MAVVKCKECGSQVSTKAKACPSCGAKPPQKTSLLTWAVLGTILIVLFTSMGVDTGTSTTTIVKAEPTPAELEAKRKKEAAEMKERLEVAVASQGAKALKSAMRNPDSFKLEKALVMDDGSVCYEYRAQNGFGGMNVGSAVLSADGKVFKLNSDDGFAKVWNKLCANKYGHDASKSIYWTL